MEFSIFGNFLQQSRIFAVIGISRRSALYPSMSREYNLRESYYFSLFIIDIF